MPPNTAEIVKNQQKGLVQYFFFDPKFSLTENAEVIAQIDPDLSVTSGLIADRMKSTIGHGYTPYIERLLDLGWVSMTKNIPKETDPKIPKKRTDQDLKILKRIDMILNTLPPRVPFLDHEQAEITDRERAKINEKALEMFGTIIVWRPDLTAHPTFPWRTATRVALDNQTDDSIKFGYNYRVNILTKAPEHLVKQAMQTYTRDEQNILEVLYIGMTVTDDGLPVGSPDVWEIIRRVPDGNLLLTQWTLMWALRVQSQAMYRAEKQYRKPITKDVLYRTWELAQKKWSALSWEDRGKFLTMDTLLRWEQLYQNLRDRGEKPSPTMDQTLQNMIHSASDAQKKILTESLITYIRNYQKTDLKIIEGWFPDIAQEIEAQRPRNIFRTLFQRG
jgi:hypothetical protein